MPSKTIASKTNSWMLYSTVILAVIATFFLSVDAIRCHQCNSHMEEDCTELRLNTPRAPVDTQFLRECVQKGVDPAEAFCRKTAFKIDVNGAHRIIRDCGWISDRKDRNMSCVDADNEGFKQTICTCYTDGCNSAPMSRQFNSFLAVSLSGLSILLGIKLVRWFA